jgi:cAMP-dependent protein kinase regulator
VQKPTEENNKKEKEELPEVLKENPVLDRKEDEVKRISFGNRRRGAICSEPVDTSASYVKRIIPKTPEQRQRLENALNNNIMFNSLEEEELKTVFDAMFEVNFKADSTIIRQGTIELNDFL